jgi:O-antigen/teichoic acid export membrane protein
MVVVSYAYDQQTLVTFGEEIMSVRLYLTIAAIVAILYALAFLIIPIQASLFFNSFAEARAVLYLRFCGAAVLAWGLIVWFAKDFQGWRAVRSVLISSMVGLIVNIIITIWATLAGWLNANAWGSAIVLALLLVGAAYQLSAGDRASVRRDA